MFFKVPCIHLFILTSMASTLSTRHCTQPKGQESNKTCSHDQELLVCQEPKDMQPDHLSDIHQVLQHDMNRPMSWTSKNDTMLYFQAVHL